MDTIDRAEEWRRLKEQYEGMSDEELRAVAEDGWDLTDVAQQALQTVISSRRLPFVINVVAPSRPPEPADGGIRSNPADLDLVVATRVWDQSEAHAVKDLLERAGVPSYLGPKNVETVEELNSGFDGGVDVKVSEVDSQYAGQVLANSPTSTREPEQPDYIARCPKCHSTDIVFQGLDEEARPDATTDSKFNWSCDGCGYKWKDDGIEQES